jgi:hypothetical protein
MPAIELPSEPRLYFLRSAPAALPPSAPQINWMIRAAIAVTPPSQDSA